MKRLARFFGTYFGAAVLACLVLAGWALWSGGILDGPIARQLRSSSVYTAPGVELDQTAAERIIGNRRLVVAILEPGADLQDACDSVDRAADGTVAVMLSRDGDEFDKYGCALLPGRDDTNFGKAYVAESVIGSGADEFADRPLEALKVMAVNYDLLVKAGTVPDGARTISPSLPRYLLAGAAIGAVLIGAAVLYLGARRAGRVTADRRARRDANDDARSALSADAAVLAQQIIDLDQRYSEANKASSVRAKASRLGGPKRQQGGKQHAAAQRAGDEQRAFGTKYRQVAADYADLLAEIAAADAHDDTDAAGLADRIESLSRRCAKLTNTAH